jgi:hypothetical protein
MPLKDLCTLCTNFYELACVSKPNSIRIVDLIAKKSKVGEKFCLEAPALLSFLGVGTPTNKKTGPGPAAHI